MISNDFVTLNYISYYVRYPACLVCIVVCIYDHGPNGILHENVYVYVSPHNNHIIILYGALTRQNK